MDSPEKRTIKGDVAAAIRVLMRGIPPLPARMEVHSVRWGGEPCPSITELAVGKRGELTVDAEPPTPSAIVDEPSKSSSDVFCAGIGATGTLVIERGMSDVVTETFHKDRDSTTIARVHGWTWRIDDSRGPLPRLWAANLDFGESQTPRVLWWPVGNASYEHGQRWARGWCFGTTRGRVMLVPTASDRERWSLAFETIDGLAPAASFVSDALWAIGFVFGQPIGLGVLRAIGDRDVCLGAVQSLSAIRPSTRTRAPALPLQQAHEWAAGFVEAIVDALAGPANRAVRVAMHLYFTSVEGVLDNQFLHAWIAAESLASWGMKNGMLRNGGPTRIADQNQWSEWVKAHEKEIRALAVPGQEGQLVDRVRSSGDDRSSPVQKVILGEGWPWTPEMKEVAAVRNEVAHEGAMRHGSTHDMERTSRCIGTIRTILTALIAKIVGYMGPISDRAATMRELNADDEPAWWPRAARADGPFYELEGAPT